MPQFRFSIFHFPLPIFSSLGSRLPGLPSSGKPGRGNSCGRCASPLRRARTIDQTTSTPRLPTASDYFAPSVTDSEFALFDSSLPSPSISEFNFRSDVSGVILTLPKQPGPTLHYSTVPIFSSIHQSITHRSLRRRETTPVWLQAPAIRAAERPPSNDRSAESAVLSVAQPGPRSLLVSVASVSDSPAPCIRQVRTPRLGAA